MSQAAEKTGSLELIETSAIEKRIFAVRGRQVMLDEDLADLYGVETKRLVQQVKRNLKRFPEDFMFQLGKAEAEALRSQIATSNEGRGGRRYAPYVFTEQGSRDALRGSPKRPSHCRQHRDHARVRRVAPSGIGLRDAGETARSARTRYEFAKLGQHDEQPNEVFKVLRQLIAPPVRPKRAIGFRAPEDE